jgi:outer membrane protein assembly factor BamA
MQGAVSAARLSNSAFRLMRTSVAAVALIGMFPAGASAARLASIHAAGSTRYTEQQIIAASGLRIGMDITHDDLQKTCDRLGATGAFTAVAYRYVGEAGGWSVTLHVTDASVTLPCIFGNLVWFSSHDLAAAIAKRVPLWSDPLPYNGNLPQQVDAALGAILEQKGIHAGVSDTFYSRAPGAPIEAIEFKADGVNIPILRVDFQGAAHVDAKALEDSTKLLLGMSYDFVDVRSFIVLNSGPLYWKQGYLRVDFGAPNPEVVPGSTSEVTVAVPVNEGAQYNLAGIEWKGNHAFSSGDLSKQIGLETGKPADGVRFSDNLDDVRKLYGSKGYLMAQVTPQPQFDDAARTVRYEVLINEGDQFHMGNLQILGLDADLTDKLKANCRLQPGDPFDQTYWNTFFKENGPLLPRTQFGWNVGIKQFPHFSEKTVDVTIKYELKTKP